MRVLAITQARFNSTRLEGKVLKEIKGKSLLEIHFNRLSKSKLITDSILATTILKSDDLIVNLARKLEWKFYRGSVDDVLSRFVDSIDSLGYQPDYIVRLTADCPLIDPELIDLIIQKTIGEKVDYCSNTLKPTFPDGFDIEVFNFQTLKIANNKSILFSDREHVTPYIIRNSSFNGCNEFNSLNYECEKNYSNIRLTVDEDSDFIVVEKLISLLGFDLSWRDYSNEYLNNDEINSLNSYIRRNEGYFKSLENDNAKFPKIR